MISKALGNILRIHRYHVRYKKEKLKHLDLHPALHMFISRICREPGLTQDQIANHLCMDKTTVAHQLTKLEEGGYIERRPSPKDARFRLVYPTAKAEAIYPEIHESYEIFTEEIMKGLTEADRAELTRLTSIMMENASALIDKKKEAKNP